MWPNPYCILTKGNLINNGGYLWLLVEGYISALLAMFRQCRMFLPKHSTNTASSTPSKSDNEVRRYVLVLWVPKKEFRCLTLHSLQWWHYTWLSRSTFVLWPQCVREQKAYRPSPDSQIPKFSRSLWVLLRMRSWEQLRERTLFHVDGGGFQN